MIANVLSIVNAHVAAALAAQRNSGYFVPVVQSNGVAPAYVEITTGMTSMDWKALFDELAGTSVFQDYFGINCTSWFSAQDVATAFGWTLLNSQRLLALLSTANFDESAEYHFDISFDTDATNGSINVFPIPKGRLKTLPIRPTR